MKLQPITYVYITCNSCKKSYKIFASTWDEIKSMKVDEDKRLMFCCPHCDFAFVENTDFSSICSDKDENKINDFLKQWHDRVKCNPYTPAAHDAIVWREVMGIKELEVDDYIKQLKEDISDNLKWSNKDDIK